MAKVIKEKIGKAYSVKLIRFEKRVDGKHPSFTVQVDRGHKSFVLTFTREDFADTAYTMAINAQNIHIHP